MNLQQPENVWDYPRPPAIEPVPYELRIEMDGLEIASSKSAFRILETSHPPTYYLPPTDIDLTCLQPGHGVSICEWKGRARYWTYCREGREVENLAWSYAQPVQKFNALANHLAFYPSKVDAAYVGGQRVTPQEGDFYGGWITPNLVGPFKGGPGTMGW